MMRDSIEANRDTKKSRCCDKDPEQTKGDRGDFLPNRSKDDCGSVCEAIGFRVLQLEDAYDI
jgi:hypothetical protein